MLHDFLWNLLLMTTAFFLTVFQGIPFSMWLVMLLSLVTSTELVVKRSEPLIEVISEIAATEIVLIIFILLILLGLVAARQAKVF